MKTSYAMVPNANVCAVMGWQNATSVKDNPNATSPKWHVEYTIGGQKRYTAGRPLAQHNAMIEGMGAVAYARIENAALALASLNTEALVAELVRRAGAPKDAATQALRSWDLDPLKAHMDIDRENTIALRKKHDVNAQDLNQESVPADALDDVLPVLSRIAYDQSPSDAAVRELRHWLMDRGSYGASNAQAVSLIE